MAKKKDLKADIQKARRPHIFEDLHEAARQESGKPEPRETAKVEKRKSVKTEKRIDGITDKRITAKTEIRKPFKMTFYMKPEIRQAWRMYEAEQEGTGRRVSFQGTVDDYLRRLLREYLK